MEDKKHLLFKKISLPEIGEINCPTVEEVIRLSNEQYNKIMYPFLVTLDDIKLEKSHIEEKEKELGRKYTIFDCLTSYPDAIKGMIVSLNFFYKTKYIKYNFNSFFINCDLIGEELITNGYPIILTYNNWDTLCDFIKELMWLSNAKREERKVTVEHEENNPILQEYLRLRQQQEEENRKLAQKNALTIHDIVTVVASDCLWDYDKVLNMTYYRLILSYRAIMCKDNYDTSLRYHTSYKFDTSNMKIEHWTDSMKKG